MNRGLKFIKLFKNIKTRPIVSRATISILSYGENWLLPWGTPHEWLWPMEAFVQHLVSWDVDEGLRLPVPSQGDFGFPSSNLSTYLCLCSEWSTVHRCPIWLGCRRGCDWSLQRAGDNSHSHQSSAVSSLSLLRAALVPSLVTVSPAAVPGISPASWGGTCSLCLASVSKSCKWDLSLH